MYIGAFTDCVMVEDTEDPRWFSHLKYINKSGSLCTIYISMRGVETTSKGEFTNGSGSYSHYYISEGISYDLDVKSQSKSKIIS